MKFGFRTSIFLLAALLFTANAFAADDEKLDHDNSILSIFVQPSISFLSFSEREYFQNAIDTIYYGFKGSAVNSAESLNVAKQDFQKVNFCFPITAGIQFQVMQDHFISAGIGFIYDHESVVLTDRKSSTHSYEYTLQGVPFFLEYRLALPPNFITLSTGGLFSIGVRWYWVLPGTEIYTTWGYLGAKTPLYGAGFGVSLGYLFASWKYFKLYGDIGFNSISVKSDKKFSDIVPNGPNENAKWNLGGIQLQIRASFGVWNKPKLKDDDDDDDDDDSPRRIRKKKLAADSTIADSAKVATDSTVADTSVTDTTKANTTKADTSKVAADSTIADSLKKVAADTTKVTDSLKVANDSAKVVESKKAAKDTLGAAANTAKAVADTTKQAKKPDENGSKKIEEPAKKEPAKQPPEPAPKDNVKSKGD